MLHRLSGQPGTQSKTLFQNKICVTLSQVLLSIAVILTLEETEAEELPRIQS